VSRDDVIVWASLADGSHGGCRRSDLIIVRECDMTPEEQAAWWNDDGDEVEILSGAHRREEIYRGALAVRQVCDTFGLAWEWDEASGGIVVWAEGAPSLCDIVEGNTEEATK